MNWKMKRRMESAACFLMLVLCLCGMIFLPVQRIAVANAAQARGEVYVYDEAEILSISERNSLSDYLEKMGKKAGCGIYVLTSANSGNGTSDKYLEDFYDDGFKTGEINPDAVLVHIDMQSRYVNVQAYGKAMEKIPDAKGERIIDAMYEDLHDGSYYDACITYAKKVEYYMNYVPVYLRGWVQLLAAFVIGGIAVGVMAANSGGRMTVSAHTYLDQRYSGVRARRDDYIRTSITKKKKPERTSSGGGGGHTSSGGHSHSSAGRHF